MCERQRAERLAVIQRDCQPRVDPHTAALSWSGVSPCQSEWTQSRGTGDTFSGNQHEAKGRRVTARCSKRSMVRGS